MNLNTIAKKVALTATLAIVMSVVSAADTANPFIGKWVLNIQKSNFGSDPPLKSAVFMISDAGDGKWHSTVDYVEGDTSTHAEYTTAADGKAVPVTGTAELDSVIVKKIGSSMITFVFKKGHKRVEWGMYKLSNNGKTLRGPISGVEPDGKTWKWHYVFDRG